MPDSGSHVGHGRHGILERFGLNVRIDPADSLVKGNHDYDAPFDPRITDLHLKTVEIDGLTFGGFGGSWRYKPKGAFLFEQDEVSTALSAFPRVDIFVAHNSPRLQTVHFARI